MSLLNLALAIAVASLVHIGTIALAGRAVGMALRSMAFGAGPTLFRISLLEVRALPVGGHVRFLHSVEDHVPQEHWPMTVDRSSVPAQLFVVLSGCTVLFGLAVALQGHEAVTAFLALPGQWLGGLFSPFGDAQVLLRQVADAAQTLPFTALLGLVAAKVAALNLLPLPPLNGGAALAVLAKHLGLARGTWPLTANRAFLCLWLAVMCVWLAATAAFVLGL